MNAFLHILFLLSGAAGLIYELAWSRYLALFVGHAAYAQVLVIGVYLGGMSLGALAVGRRSSRVARPLLWYAAAEIVLAGFGLVFHPLFTIATEFAYQSVFPATVGSWALDAAKWGIAASLILPQSVLLGATFPLMTAAVARRAPGSAGASVASLYFVNALGGAAGLLVAGFALVAWLGLPGTVGAAAALNVVAAVGAYLVGREARDERAVAGRARPGHYADAGARAGVVPWRLMLAVAFLTAVASFAYQIGWIRLLSLVMGSATHAFELMLSAFILGLALGALAIGPWAQRHPDPRRLLGWIQWGMGFAALLTLPLYTVSFEAMASLVSWLNSGGSYVGFNLARYGLGLLIMLPSTFLAGMTVPLITATLLRSGGGEASIGAVYGANTLGSIFGVALAGLVLMPVLGVKGLLVAGAVLDMGLGVGLLAGVSATRPGRTVALAGVTAAAALLVLLGLRLDRALLTSGVFRYGVIDEEQRVLFYDDGRTATVSMHVTGRDSLRVLSTNGKPDASLTPRWIRGGGEPEPIYQQDEATQSLTALIAHAHAPAAETAAVIGHGSGISAHFLLAGPALREVVTVEIEPEMYEASRLYLPANRRTYEDPRSTRVVADAKSYLAQAGRRYDLILSEPSNPWVSGTATLFSLEFYERVRGFLEPGGVFAQWFHLYEISDELVASMLAALHASFPDYRIFATADTDILIVATTGDRLPEPDWSVFEAPDVRRGLRHVPEITAAHLSAMRVVEGETLAPLLDGWPTPNSDLYPVLDLGAERARLLGAFATGFHGLVVDRFSFGQVMEARTVALPDHVVPPFTTIERIESTAGAAALRRSADDGAAGPDPDRREIRRLEAFLEQLRTDAPPDDWLHWIRQVERLDFELHGIPLTTIDRDFYDSLEEYLQRWHAPEGPRAAVLFRRSLAEGDHRTAALAAQRLIDIPATTGWVDGRVLLEGGVASAIRTGDLELGGRILQFAAPLTGWDDGDIRLRWIRSALESERSSAERPHR
ncbi:MAG: fused MFS/spermidine synthase [Gemmatimonadota bacterium]